MNHPVKGDPMRYALARVALVLPALMVGLGTIAASPCTAQTRVTSLEELRRELAAGDFITIVRAAGPAVAGRLMRLGDVDLEVRLVNKRTPEARGPRDVTIPLNAIESLERRRDSSRNGAAIGAGIGAGFGGAMFVHAMIVDRNEIGEWAPIYAGNAAACAGIGALIGWAIDAANSRRHITFNAPVGAKTTVSVRPVYSRAGGIALAVSFSR